MATCSNPGCDQPGTNKCSACQATPYCGSICQTAHWVHHKEECPGHLRKIGMANLQKARGFNRERNWTQTLRHADLAAAKLKQLKDRPVEDIDQALSLKYIALGYMGRHSEALECAKEWYCLWPTKHTHPPAIEASFALIESCVFNNEFFDAVLYARTLWETIALSQDSHIPEHLQQPYIERGAMELARALFRLAEHGDMPAEEKQATGVEAIMLARRALEMHTQLRGGKPDHIAVCMDLLASIVDYFNDVDDDEIPRLHEQAKVIFARVHGSLSPNVATCERNLGNTYERRARRALAAYERRAERTEAAHDLKRYVTNLELALPHYREAVRIHRAINHMDMADMLAGEVSRIEKILQLWVNTVNGSLSTP